MSYGTAGVAIRSKAELRSWGLGFFGLCLYAISVVTFRIPGAEAGIVIGALGIFFAARESQIAFPSSFWIFIAFIIWSALSAIFAIDPAVALDELIVRVKLAVVFLVTVNALRTEIDVRRFLIVASVAFLLYPARGALVNYVTGNRLFGRALWNGIYANPNDLAGIALLFLGISIALALAPSNSRAVRVYAWCSGGVYLVLIFLTQSRGAFLGLAFGLLLPLLRWCAGDRRRVIGAVVAGVCVALLVPSAAWDRLAGISKLTSIDTIASADPEGSAAQRFDIQQAGFRIFTDNPFVGVGLGNFSSALKAYSPELGKRDTHNTYLNLGTEVGLPGLVLWVSFVLSALAYSRSARKEDIASDTSTLSIVWVERAFVGFLVAAIVGTYGSLNFPYIILGALVGLGRIRRVSKAKAMRLHELRIN